MNESEYSIAIIGMAARFPSSENLNEFWKNLKEAKNCITRDNSADKLGYVGAYGKLNDIGCFDADFFNMTSVEAVDSDPEQRIMMELTYHALENAGYDSSRCERKTGIYTSFSNGVYVWNYIMQSGSDWYDKYEIYKAYLSTRCEKIAYKFGFEGPAIMSEYACASSLNTIHQACQSLLNYECDMALAGGVSVDMKQEGYPASLATTSSKGCMRPFDKDADGLVPGSGAGIVVLRRYEDAVNDHDNIIAVIKGTFVNNDGNKKAGFAAPSVFGQTECLRSVLSVSDVESDDIDYYETHGTATELGDSIELRAIKNVVGNRSNNNKLYIGSVKSNIGHTNMAAGVANVIKAALILRNRTIVPTVNFEHPCSELEDTAGHVCVASETVKFNKDKQMLAVCSAIGMGGANAMAVLGEPYEKTSRSKEDRSLSHLLIFSAKTKEALSEIAKETLECIKENSIRVDDAAFTLQKGRTDHKFRAYEIFGEGAENKLRRIRCFDNENKKRIVFVLSGAGSFDRTIGKELYKSFHIFRKYMDTCFDCCEQNGIKGIKEDFLNFDVSAEVIMDNIRGIQILFALGYSLAKTYMELGITPDAVIGHSNGEYIAAVISGIIKLSDAVFLLKKRAELMEKLPEGAIINVAAPLKDVEKLLVEGVTIGAVNAPGRIMVTGKKENIDLFENKLIENELMYSRMHVNRASHCGLMKTIADEYYSILRTISFNKPSIKIVSCCEADLSENSADMQTPEYWVKQMCEPVNFYDSVIKIDNEAKSIFIEMSTGDTLTSMIRKMKPVDDAISAFASFDSPAAVNSRDGFLASLGDLWCNGITPDWEKLYEEKPYKVSLANYPFKRTNYWKFNADLNLDTGLSARDQNILICDGLSEAEFSKTKYIIQENAGNIVLAESENEQYFTNDAISSLFTQTKDFKKAVKEKFFNCTDVTLLRDVEGFEEDSNRLCAACIMDYFKLSPQFDPDDVYTLDSIVNIMGAVEKHIPFIRYFISFLTDYQYISNEFGLIRFLPSAKKLPDKNKLLAQYSEKYPMQCAYLEFCVYASDHYYEVFRGEKEGSPVIYPEGKFDLIYKYESRMKKYSYTDQCIQSLAEAVYQAVRSSGRRIRILEAGAGSGEMTDIILSRLQGLDFEYWFTDIKPSLVNVRKNSENKANSFMRYKTLDISKSAASQGFTENSFDVIILYDVIQATQNIHNTLGNISSLLADNGMFSFVQTCDGIELLNMIFGYAPGWWNYCGDPDRNRITMPPQKWRECLDTYGFNNVFSFPEDGTSNAYLFMMQKKSDNKTRKNFCSEVKNEHYSMIKKQYPDLTAVFVDLNSEDDIKAAAKKYDCQIIINNDLDSETAELNNGSRSTLDDSVIKIVKDILGCDVTIDDDLYELGMDSLMAMMISSKIQKELGYNMQLSDMYDISCVREISDFLGSADKTEISGTNVDISCEPEKSLDDLFDDL